MSDENNRAVEPTANSLRKLQDIGLQNKIVGALQCGRSRAQAAKRVGCSVSSIARECQLDERFAKLVREAEFSGEIALEECLFNAATGKATKGDWRAALALLERKYWEKWAKRSPDSISPEQLFSYMSRMASIVFPFIPPEKQLEVRSQLDLFLSSLGSGTVIDVKADSDGQ